MSCDRNGFAGTTAIRKDVHTHLTVKLSIDADTTGSEQEIYAPNGQKLRVVDAYYHGISGTACINDIKHKTTPVWPKDANADSDYGALIMLEDQTREALYDHGCCEGGSKMRNGGSVLAGLIRGMELTEDNPLKFTPRNDHAANALVGYLTFVVVAVD